MERKTISQVPIYVRDAVNRANRQAMGHDYAGAVKSLLPVLQKNPEIPVLFEKFFEYGFAKERTQNGAARALWLLLSVPMFLVLKVLMFINPVQTMKICEGFLAGSINNPIMLTLLADASDCADVPWGASTALSAIRKFSPNNEANLRRLAVAMQNNGQASEALRIYQAIAKRSPSSHAAQNELRSAMALASIERGRFGEDNPGGSQGANTADAKDAVIQQLLDGTIHDAQQASVLIERFTEDLKANDSVDIRRKLADAYMVSEKYEDALREYKTVAQKLGVTDPVLDKHIEKAYLALQMSKIAKLQQEPQSAETEAQIAALQKDHDDYHWQHVKDRAERFPNDMQLQFDWGELLFERQMIEDAVTIFTRVAENPQKRRASLVYLARCAILTGDFEKSKACLEEAIKEMYRTDKYKREALYYLGQTLEALGDNAGALEKYKTITVSMANYRDVPQRMARLQGEASASVPGNSEEKSQ